MIDFYAMSAGEQAECVEGLAVQALKNWGVSDCKPELVKFRENAVFRVIESTGRPAALRIHRHSYHSDAALRSELAWMQSLCADGFDVPRVLPTLADETFAIVAAERVPEPRQVDMLAWLPGRPFGSIETGLDPALTDIRATFVMVGQLAARLHDHAQTWQRPAGFVRHAWDLDGLVGEQPVWGQFWELSALAPDQRVLIDHARARAQRDLVSFGRSSATFGLIHADLLVENLLLNGDRVSLIDFDDSGFGWHLFDLATASFFFRGTDAFNPIRQGMIDGYRSVRALPDEQLEIMPLFDLLRGFTYLGWVHTRYVTQTAKEMAPVIVELACQVAEDFLAG